MRAFVLGLLAVACMTVSGASAPLVLREFPVPPEQGTPLIPANLKSATEALFAMGFPDPRGCEYREIQVRVSSVWGRDPQVVSTAGWVLPASALTAERYAICWNGLIYPVAKLGVQADLHADAEALIPPNPLRVNRGLGEIRAVFATNSPSTRILLLLRSGEIKSAVKNWVPDNHTMVQAQIRQKHPPEKVGAIEAYDPFLELAEDWAWALFDSLICAHMRGDLKLALAGAKKLAEVKPKIEAEAEKRKFTRPQYSDSLKRDTPRSYLGFLDQLPQILADLQRRASQPKEATIIDRGLTNLASSSRRIEALIEDLDLVQARQSGQPGIVILEQDPIVRALIQEGDNAVEPLLDCLEKDKRLTRSVGFSRDFHRNRVVISVASAARAALRQILQVQFQSASEFRAYWAVNQGTKLEDRWYRTLKDDKAGLEQWLQTARNIMQPDNIVGVAGSGHYMRLPVEPGRQPKLRGEALRGKRNPSVSESLVARAEGLAKEAAMQDQFRGVEALRNGCEFVTILAEWENPGVAVPVARTLMRRAIELFADPNSYIMSSGHDLARYIPQLTQVRLNGGDTTVSAEYAAWIKSADPQKLDSYAMDAFQPLWRNPDELGLMAVGEWLFNDPASPWSRLPWKRAGFRNPVESELIKLAGFRRLLIRELDNSGLAGTMQWRSPNVVIYELKEHGSGSRGVQWPEAEPPADGIKVDVRRCDWIAWSLSNAKQIPFFNPFAPAQMRDEAIRLAKDVLGGEKSTRTP